MAAVTFCQIPSKKLPTEASRPDVEEGADVDEEADADEDAVGVGR